MKLRHALRLVASGCWDVRKSFCECLLPGEVLKEVCTFHTPDLSQAASEWSNFSWPVCFQSKDQHTLFVNILKTFKGRRVCSQHVFEIPSPGMYVIPKTCLTKFVFPGQQTYFSCQPKRCLVIKKFSYRCQVALVVNNSIQFMYCTLCRYTCMTVV